MKDELAKELAVKAAKIEILEELNEDFTVEWTYQDISNWIRIKLEEI